MDSHPSLNAPPLRADPINPVEKMGRNEQCWCGSGLKYKKCHSDRERQAPINIFEAEQKMITLLREGYCSHPDPDSDPCSPRIIKAHTIQKKGGLAEISEAGHVLTAKPSMKEMIESQGKPSPRKVGVNSASVFPGFCNKHDTAMFKPIEGETVSLNKDTAFLFSYRAIAYERFAKEAQLKGISVQRELDRGCSFLQQRMIQMHLKTYESGVKVGMRDVDRWKKQFDERLLSGARDDFHFLAVRFDRILPIVACGAFHPEYDVQGKPLQRLGRNSADYDHITVNVTSLNGQTISVFGWVGSEVGAAGAFASSFARVPDGRKADVLLRLLFLQTDNLFLRPSWWGSLQTSRRAAFTELMMSGTPTRRRSANEFVDDQESVTSAAIVGIVSG